MHQRDGDSILAGHVYTAMFHVKHHAMTGWVALILYGLPLRFLRLLLRQ